jgi:cytochrome bd ubiquinol oxidase subunit I
MIHLLAARAQMGFSLGFHIVFAAVGIAMPLLMIIAEGCWLRTGEPVYLELAKRWAKGTAILFAVGAVSGTVLSFELGLLWPTFMAYAGPIIGMPFSLEGFAFFLEAIFLGIYFYGWKKVSPWAHWFAGLMVLVGGTFSGIFVVTANAWMNTPAGFDVVQGHVANVRPLAAMLNPAAWTQALHMTIAAFQSVGFVVAGVHAFMLLKDKRDLVHRRAMGIALAVGGVMAILQPVSGDFLARQVARNQPVKLAALEGQWETARSAPLRVGGWADAAAERTRFALEIPGGLSLLAYHDFYATVAGLKSFPREDRPPVAIVHAAFQIMVAAGVCMLFVALLAVVWILKTRRLPDAPWFLRLVVGSAPLGFVAIEAGWIVTEVGRQPWIIYHFMRTSEAVTPVPGLGIPFAVFGLVYVLLAATVFLLLRRQVFARRAHA